jgi:hypothetical protein
MESVLEYCKGQIDLNASYNADHLADCRRTISVSCSSNKKGIAAKKALIERFFYEQKCRVCGCTDNNACEGGCYWVEDDLCSKCAENSCDEVDCPFNNSYNSCCFSDEDPDSDGYHRDVIGAVDGYGCKNENVLRQYKAITNTDSTDNTIDAQVDNKPECDSDCEPKGDLEEKLDELLKDGNRKDSEEMHIDNSQKCISSNEKCGHYCSHNTGCSLLLVGKEILKDILEEIKNGHCDYSFIEVMCCPGGCIGGGGQPVNPTTSVKQKRINAIYREDRNKSIRKSHNNPAILKLYSEYLGEPCGDISHKLLHTHYTPKNI